MTITINRKFGIPAIAVGLVILALAILSGCSQKFIEPFRDAPTSGHNGTSAQVIEQPDGFSNAAEKCDGYGHLIVTTYHGDRAYAAVAVINDARCGSLTAALPFGH